MGGKRDTSTVPELEQDMGFQHLEWLFQRLGWLALALIVLASMLGLLGPGLLTRAVAVQGPLAIAYDRIVRREAPFDLEIRLRSGPGRSAARLELSSDCLEDTEAGNPVPAPDSAMGGEGGMVTWVFRLDPAPGEKRIIIPLTARACGRRSCRISADGDAPAQFRQWTLP